MDLTSVQACDEWKGPGVRGRAFHARQNLALRQSRRGAQPVRLVLVGAIDVDDDEKNG